ncbi:hypothetical protein FGB62_10g113 [Gracilaria domingensis]|nr:hypothetical protein FGB62_10g113 [Gracilaria domingensis]
MDAPILPSQTQSFPERAQSRFAALFKHATLRNALILVATVAMAALALSSPSLGVTGRSRAVWMPSPSFGSRAMPNNIAHARSMNALRYPAKACTRESRVAITSRCVAPSPALPTQLQTHALA